MELFLLSYEKASFYEFEREGQNMCTIYDGRDVWELKTESSLSMSVIYPYI